MPLSKIQTEVLRLLASHRDPESYVAGATPLNREGRRYSEDIDVFHDRAERVGVRRPERCTSARNAPVFSGFTVADHAFERARTS